MAISDYKAGLDKIAQSIAANKAQAKKAIQRIVSAHDALNALPSSYASILAEIDGLGNDPSEAVAKDEKAKLTAEFLSLIDDLAAINLAITNTGITL